MRVETVPYSFDNFSYIIICTKTGEAAIVDPGEYYPISQAVGELGVKVTTILCTHHHGDHIGGLEEFCEEYPSVDVVGFKKDQRRIQRMNKGVGDGDIVRVGEQQGSVLYTPGHTGGSICFSFDGHLFTGDTLFGGGCGRLFEGTPIEMYESLQSLVRVASPETKIYFGHEYTISNLTFALTVEPANSAITSRLNEAEEILKNGGATTPSTMALELVTNPFLRSEAATILKTITDKGLAEGADPLSIFTAVRQLKDNF